MIKIREKAGQYVEVLVNGDWKFVGCISDSPGEIVELLLKELGQEFQWEEYPEEEVQG